MRWTQDQQGAVIVALVAAEFLISELAVAALWVQVEDALGWLVVAVFVDVAAVQILAERRGRRGPLGAMLPAPRGGRRGTAP